MKKIVLTSFSASLLAAALLTGCGSVGYGPDWNGGHHGPYDRDGRYDRGFGDVQGTVSRVDPRNRVIVLDREGYGDRYDLRNGRNGDDGRQAYLYYDESTTVEFQGRTFRPEDLEAGDRIAADLDREGWEGGGRPVVRSIQVLYDVSSGNGSTWDGRYDRGDRDETASLRGTVRDLDTRNQTLEIDREGYSSGDDVTVRYDRNTLVRYQGRRYGAESLERGDVVEIVGAQDNRGDLLAQEIVVVSNGGAGR
jgi:hypothetical protein